MSFFTVGYGLLMPLWILLGIAGVDGVSVFPYSAVALIPVHVVCTYIEHVLGHQLVQRMGFAIAWWSIPVVFVTGTFLVVATGGTGLTTEISVLLMAGAVVATPVIAALHIRSFRREVLVSDTKALAVGPRDGRGGGTIAGG